MLGPLRFFFAGGISSEPLAPGVQRAADGRFFAGALPVAAAAELSSAIGASGATSAAEPPSSGPPAAPAVVARGWADAPEEVVLGINAVSVPVRDQRGELIAMVSAMDSIQFIPTEPPQKLVDGLRAAAAAISAKLAI